MKSILRIALIAAMMAFGSAAAHKGHERASDKSLSHKDPRDVDNKLDIDRVAFRGHGDGRATLVVHTRHKWGCRYISGTALDDGGVASMRWMLDSNRDPYNEREAFFGCAEGEWLLGWSENKTFKARRPNRRTLRVTLPLDDLGLDRKKHLSFTALSFANGAFGEDVYVEESDASPELLPLADRD
jgi:hypothetical protein